VGDNELQQSAHDRRRDLPGLVLGPVIGNRNAGGDLRYQPLRRGRLDDAFGYGSSGREPELLAFHQPTHRHDLPGGQLGGITNRRRDQAADIISVTCPLKPALGLVREQPGAIGQRLGEDGRPVHALDQPGGQPIYHNRSVSKSHRE
jgi:hypothetical protein